MHKAMKLSPSQVSIDAGQRAGSFIILIFVIFCVGIKRIFSPGMAAWCRLRLPSRRLKLWVGEDLTKVQLV
jgi:hypothetical protein